MTISYPLTLPTSGIKHIEMTQHNSTASSQSPFTGQQQFQTYTGQWWSASVTLCTLNRASAAEWQSFLAKLRGKQGTFMMGDPDAATPQGTPVGTPLVNGASQTGNTIITDGWTASADDVLLAGDYIQIGNHMYMVLDDVSADGSGNATFDVWPRLRADVDNNDPITTSSCKTIWRLSSNAFVWAADVNGYYTITFECTEDING